MTPKHSFTLRSILLLFAALSLSSCAIASNKPPISEIYAQFYCSPYHLGHYFFSFQNSFLNIVLFILLFTLFQYWQNGRPDYLHYAFYLLITWLYFARAFPPYFYHLFSTYGDYTQFDGFLRLTEPNAAFRDQIEFIFFHFLTAFYILFIRTFFNLKDQQPQVERLVKIGLTLLFASGLLLTLLLVLFGYYLNGSQTLFLKQMYLLPAFWLMVKVIKAKLPGATHIVIGSGALVAGSILVGMLYLFEDTLVGKRVFMQMGALLEILFFSAALGRKDWVMHLRLSATIQENEQITQEKQRIEQEKRLTEQRINQLQNKLRRQIDKIRDLQKKLEKRFNGNNSLKPKPAAEETFTEKLERVMAEHYMNSAFSIPDLADLMQLGQQTLNRRIKGLHGVSSATYLCHYRLERSKAFMLNRSLKLHDISTKVGFSQYDEYSRQFKQKEGISPKKFRKNLLGRS